MIVYKYYLIIYEYYLIILTLYLQKNIDKFDFFNLKEVEGEGEGFKLGILKMLKMVLTAVFWHWT